MARKVFYSFHYVPDSFRAARVRNAGVLEGNQTLSDNKWEEVIGGGDPAIESWIATEMSGKSCLVVLIGSGTAGRKWIKHEIKKAWDDGKGVVGVYVHNLRDHNSEQSTKGANPFEAFTVGKDKTLMSKVVKAYNPNSTDSKQVYKIITDNLATWVEEAITIRTDSKV
jgi:MTH538 TIR-like domain (DUF1863)